MEHISKKSRRTFWVGKLRESRVLWQARNNIAWWCHSEVQNFHLCDHSTVQGPRGCQSVLCVRTVPSLACSKNKIDVKLKLAIPVQRVFKFMALLLNAKCVGSAQRLVHPIADIVVRCSINMVSLSNAQHV